MNPLMQLKRLGQSVWYDTIRRGLVTSGELKRMAEVYGITGVTSNPAIFEKAIAGTAEYDTAIAELVNAGMGDAGIVNELMIKDVQMAADLLAGAHREAGGKDGFVSIEVRPALAHDAQASINEARQFFKSIDRPNVMVKIPATVEGLKAIEELTYEGYSINVTLLFSVGRYEEAARAYVRGLERRAAEGKPVDNISGVASFFVSRVDSLADKLIDERIERTASSGGKARLRDLIGKTAIANARLAYMRFTDIFEGAGFRGLKEKGASPQRLLWASTGTKDPRYPDVKYVDGLIGKGTVNTMPLQTLHAYHDHGRPRLTLAESPDEARHVMAELMELGVDYEMMTGRLEDEGIKGFAESYDSLLRCIAGKRETLGEKALRLNEYHLGRYGQDVQTAIERLDNENFLERLWAKDPALWKDTPQAKDVIKQALGWLALPDMMESHLDSITSFASEIKGGGFSHAVLLGMGGSSLAPLVLRETFGTAPGYPELIVLDSTDPGAVRGVEERIDIENTLFIVSSKSGSTIEPLSFFEYFHKRLSDSKGEDAGRNFIAITDPGTSLEGFSRKYRFRRVFLNPGDIGGRFSALSFFGLVPAALAGIDISKLLYSASCVLASVHPACTRNAGNPAVVLGAVLGVLGRAGRDKLTFFTSREISSFGLWIEQLIAESTGKEGKGLVPVTGEPIGPPEAYGNDRVFIYIGRGPVQSGDEKMLTALKEAGHPVIIFRLKDIHEIGGEFLRWEIATATAGSILGINPFDQPDVEIAKKLTVARLNRKKETGAAAVPPGAGFDGARFKAYFGRSASQTAGGPEGGLKDALGKFMGLIREGDYIGVLAYYNPQDKALGKCLSEIRDALRESTRAATQFGYGPRYLHSTGQLHKGGAKNGVFIIFCHETDEDIEIPGSPFSFSELELSQAFGDMEALDSKGCRVVLINAIDQSAGSFREVESYIKEALRRR